MPHTWVCLVLFIIAVVVFFVSYGCQNYQWVSSLLLSSGVGILTGIIVFFLGNIRNRVKDDIDRKVEQFNGLYQILINVYHSLPGFNPERYDYTDCACQTLQASLEYIEAIRRLDHQFLLEFINETGITLAGMTQEIYDIYEKYSFENLQYKDAAVIRIEVIRIFKMQQIGLRSN